VAFRRWNAHRVPPIGESRAGSLMQHGQLVRNFGKVVRVRAVHARIPGSNPTVDGYISTSFLKAL